MSLESPVNYLDDLNVANPVTGDPRSEGDDHIRNVKTAIKQTFPGMSGRFRRTQSKSSNYTAVATDNTTAFICTAALTIALTAVATLGNGYEFIAYANGADITIDPNASETINGATTATVKDGTGALVLSSGTAFHAFALPKLTSAGGFNFGAAPLTATGGGSLTGTWSNLGTVTTIDINGGTLDGVVIGGASAAAATFTTVNTNNRVVVTTTGNAVDCLQLTPDTSKYAWKATTAANTFSGFQVARTVNTAASWDVYIPAGSTDFRFYDGTADRLIINASGINGTLGATTPAAATVTTLTASDTFTTTKSGNYLLRNGATTLATYERVTTTGGDMALGVESSGGGVLLAGSTAYATILQSLGNTPVQIGVNNSLIGSFSSTGLAVTGAMSATDNLTLSGATAELKFTGASYGWVRSTVGDLYIDAPTGKSIYGRINGATVTNTTSAGLVVTGALSATGLVSSELAYIAATDGVNGFQVRTIAGANGMIFANYANNVEFGRFDASGNLLVGATSNPLSSRLYSLAPTGANVAIAGKNDTASGIVCALWNAGTSGDNKFAEFATEGSYTARGSIDYNRAGGAVRYNTSSDARLKNDLGIATSVDVLRDTLVHDFEWRENGNRARGVFAQEAYTVIPNAVKVGDSGDVVKDAWQVDYSKYVPDLIVGWQDHEARIAYLESVLAANGISVH